MCQKRRRQESFFPCRSETFSNGVWLERPVKKSLNGIAEELNREVKAVRDKSKGNLFYPEPFLAISNVGTLGAIENASATLTGDVVSELVICSMIDKPWVVNGAMEARKIMNLVIGLGSFCRSREHASRIPYGGKGSAREPGEVVSEMLFMKV